MIARARLRPWRHGGPEENQGLQGMNSDAHGLEERREPVGWKPAPDMYRTDTPEAREAYEASFQMTIAPRLGAERRSVELVIPPGEPSQTRAILG
jgi:hypothetical protein